MMRTPFRKLLVANRSEIALRIARTARALGYRTVAVYSTADTHSAHVAGCDEAVHIGATPPAESYLNISRIIAAARLCGADAVHPGYGFLAENAAFAEACRAAGLVFIGPSPEAIAAMGDKARAKVLMRGAGVPCIPGYEGENQDIPTLLEAALATGFPLMIKATAGGGGRGIRRVDRLEDFEHALRSARSEATTAFGDARVILERIVESPRHVEVQIFGDRYGHVIHLGERDCSVQRRYQKLVEEAPSPVVGKELRKRMGEAAVRAAKAIAYEGAGTVEFLLDCEGNFYFMEMNTRLQVEHTVTEEITGLDLVEWQLRLAAGEPLPLAQDEVVLDGHSIQVRLCSEDPRAAFLPQGGRMHLWKLPAGIRVEHALASGAVVPTDYDSMIAKLVTWGRDREEARRRMCLALEELVALGPATNREFLVACLEHSVFVDGEATTAFIDQSLAGLLMADSHHAGRATVVGVVVLHLAGRRHATETATAPGLQPRHPARWLFSLDGMEAMADIQGTGPDVLEVTVGGETHTVTLGMSGTDCLRLTLDGWSFDVCMVEADGEVIFSMAGHTHRVRDRSHEPAMHGETRLDGRVRALMAGRVVAVHAAPGETVSAGQPILTIEAMKIEHTHQAAVDGVLVELHVETGQLVTLRQVLGEVVVPPTGGSP